MTIVPSSPELSREEDIGEIAVDENDEVLKLNIPMKVRSPRRALMLILSHWISILSLA